MKKKIPASQLTVCSALIALAFVLNNLLPKIPMPYGGSITLFSMLFIYLSAYFFGPYTGTFAAVAYGLLDLLIKPSIVHPIQLLLDYPIAFGMLGFGGIFCKGRYGFQKGYLAGCIGRLLAVTVSGAVFFGSYAPVGQNAFVYSLGYNATYIIPEMIITLVVMSVPAFRNAIDSVKKKVTK